MNDQPQTIGLPAHSVVLILGDRRRGDECAALADRIPFPAAPWDVMKPQDSADRLRAAMKAGGTARVVMLDSNGKARREVASIARKHGARAVALRLPGGEEADLAAERYDAVHDLASADVAFSVVPMPSDLRHLNGPFDAIADVHGCAEELRDLLVLTGHADPETREPRRHPDGRIPILLGDLTDRGPASAETLAIARRLEELGGLRVLGNHDDKLARKLTGSDVSVAPGLAMTLEELKHLDDEARRELGEWVGSAEPHLVLDGGRLVVAHAGITRGLQGRHTAGARAFALYGKPTGGINEDGTPQAVDWALEYDGDAVVVHGHVVHREPRVVGNVVALDTGCVFGGSLSAYRWPEREFVSVPARVVHFDPSTRFEEA